MIALGLSNLSNVEQSNFNFGLNDAVIDRNPNSQLDYERELPASTGVINIKEFIDFLIRIEYSGAVRAEPFNKKLALMDDETAVKLTSKHLFKSINGSD